MRLMNLSYIDKLVVLFTSDVWLLTLRLKINAYKKMLTELYYIIHFLTASSMMMRGRGIADTSTRKANAAKRTRMSQRICWGVEKSTRTEKGRTLRLHG